MLVSCWWQEEVARLPSQFCTGRNKSITFNESSFFIQQTDKRFAKEDYSAELQEILSRNISKSR